MEKLLQAAEKMHAKLFYIWHIQECYQYDTIVFFFFSKII